MRAIHALIRSIYGSHTASLHRIYRPEAFEQPVYRKDEASVTSATTIAR